VSLLTGLPLSFFELYDFLYKALNCASNKVSNNSLNSKLVNTNEQSHAPLSDYIAAMLDVSYHTVAAKRVALSHCLYRQIQVCSRSRALHPSNLLTSKLRHEYAWWQLRGDSRICIGWHHRTGRIGTVRDEAPMPNECDYSVLPSHTGPSCFTCTRILQLPDNTQVMICTTVHSELRLYRRLCQRRIFDLVVRFFLGAFLLLKVAITNGPEQLKRCTWGKLPQPVVPFLRLLSYYPVVPILVRLNTTHIPLFESVFLTKWRPCVALYNKKLCSTT
jgi:hypothetical protein